MYPAKLVADIHLVHCTVSRTVAHIFQSSPEFISAAINAFCLPAASGSNKNYIAVMQKLGTNLNSSKIILQSLFLKDYSSKIILQRLFFKDYISCIVWTIIFLKMISLIQTIKLSSSLIFSFVRTFLIV